MSRKSSKLNTSPARFDGGTQDGYFFGRIRIFISQVHNPTRYDPTGDFLFLTEKGQMLCHNRRIRRVQ